MNKAIMGAAVAGVLLLAGCTPTTSSTQPTDSPAPSESSVAAPTPTAETPGVPALDQLVLTTEGLGDNITVEKPVNAEPASSAIVKWEPTKCKDEGFFGDGAWVPQYPETAAAGGDKAYPFVFVSAKETSPVDLLTVWSDQIRTDKGVGVGSTIAELKAAYPALKLVKHSLITDQYVITGSKGQLVFDVATKFTPESTWDRSKVGTVIWVYLENKGHLVFSIANSSFGTYVCAKE